MNLFYPAQSALLAVLTQAAAFPADGLFQGRRPARPSKWRSRWIQFARLGGVGKPGGGDGVEGDGGKRPLLLKIIEVASKFGRVLF